MDDNIERVYRYIDQSKEKFLEYLVRLCRQPSISAQGIGLQETAQVLSDMMADAGISTTLLPIAGTDSPVVRGELKGKSPYTLLFYNHYDVQPAEPLEEWLSPPFEPRIEGDLVFARGVSDNKGNIVARLAAIEAYKSVFGSFPIGIRFLIEGEEEIGSPHLREFLRSHGDLFKSDVCLWEGSNVSWDGRLNIILGVKGILCVELEATGPETDTHSSWATVLPNPIWRLAWALGTLKGPDEHILIDGFYDDVRPPTEAELKAVYSLPLEEGQELSAGTVRLLDVAQGREYWRRHLFEPTCNVCGIVSGYTGAGVKTIVPKVARAKLDFRLVPDQRPDDLLHKLRRHLDRHGFSDVKISDSIEGEPAARTPLDSPFVRQVADTAEEVYGKPPIIMPTMAATGPMAFIREALNTPVADTGVGYPDSRIHAPNENIRIDDFILGAKHVAAIIHRLGIEAQTK